MPNKLATVRPVKVSAVRPTHKGSQSVIFTTYVGKLRIKPAEQQQISLGVFGADRPAKGFSVAIRPNSVSTDAIVSKVFTVGSPARHELFMSVANFGDKSVTAEIWQI